MKQVSIEVKNMWTFKAIDKNNFIGFALFNIQ